MFLDNLLLKEDVDNFFMITVTTCSMLNYISNSDNDEINTDVYKSTRLEPTYYSS